MVCDCIMEFALHCCKKFFRNWAVNIIVSTTLGVNVRNLLIEAAFAGTDITNTLQLLLKIIFAEKVFRFP